MSDQSDVRSVEDNLKSADEVAVELKGQVSDTPDDKTKQEKSFNEKLSEEYVNKFQSDNVARIRYAEAIFVVTVLWLFLVLFVVVAVGKGFMRLSDTVLVTLITTTTIAVFGFFLVVVNYYFNKDKST